MSEIKPWSPDDAINAIRERIRAEFVAMIPPEQFTVMVKDEIKRFLATKERGYSSSRDYASDFGRIVCGELDTWTKAEVKAVLESEEWRAGAWVDGRATASLRVKELLTENAGKILESAIGVMIQNVVSSMGYHR